MTNPGVPAERERTFRVGLALRLAVALCAGAAAILVCAGALNVSLQRDHMTQFVRDSADRGADVILRATRAAMLDDAPQEVERIIAAVGAQPGIERIRIFDKQGRIRRSTLAAEVGTQVDERAEQCFGCHREDRPLERLDGDDRSRTFTNEAGRRVLSTILPIRNAPDCSSAPCHAHDPAQPLLGVLDVHLSLAKVDEQTGRSGTQTALAIVATVGAMLLLSGALMWGLVLRPVRRLREATERVAAGDLSARTPADTDDEIGDMARAWNSMVGDLQRARSDLERWSRTLETRVEEATRELEAAHRRMLLVEKMASLGKLSAVVAHEINNPLAGIATYARLLRRQAERRAATGGPAADAETLRALDLVESEAVRCGNIVRNLLTFARAPGSRFAAEDLGPILERCAALVRHQAELQEVVLRTETGPDLPKVECDASQVQQVVLALAMNALEAMPNGGSLVLSARKDPAEDQVLVEVADTGCGIPADVLPHVFEPFFTTKQEGKGVGLGLAVVYGIVERHGGRVDVESKVGAGTTFTVRLPRRRAARAGDGGADPPDARGPGAAEPEGAAAGAGAPAAGGAA